MAYLSLNPIITDQRLLTSQTQTPVPDYSFDKLVAESRSVADLLDKLSRILLRTQEAPRTLYGYLVPLCAQIFGKTGWLHSKLSPRDRDAIYCFLEPTGPLVRAAIRLTNERWVFDVVSDKLPRQTQLLLDPRLVSALPRVYDGRWELAAENAPLSQQIPTNYWNFETFAGGPMATITPVGPGNSLLGTSRSGEELRAKIKLNVFEYYMFCFGLALVGDATTMRQPPVDSSLNDSKANIALSGYASTAKAPFSTASFSPPQQSTPDLVYYELLESYLKYFLPLQQYSDVQGSHFGGERFGQSPRRRFSISSDDERGNAAGLTSVCPTKRLRTFSRAAEGILGRGADRVAGGGGMEKWKRGKGNLFIDRPLNLGAETTLAIAEFTVMILIDQWLNQNDYLPGDGYRITPTTPYIQPSIDLIHAITQLVSHLGKSDMRERAEDASLAREASRYENSTGEATSIARITKSNAYRTLQPRLYRFLRLAMDRWPADGTFEHVIKLWLTYISPWTYTNVSREGERKGAVVTKEWYPFIQQNYLFYAVLLPMFLERALAFELFDPLEAAVASGDIRRRAGLISNLAAGKCSKNRLYLNENALMLEQVMTAFQEEGLMQALKEAETAYLSTAVHNTYLNPLSAKVSPMSKSVRRSERNAMNGATIAEWMEQVEGNGFVYKQFFTSQDKISALKIMGSICQAYDVKAVLRRELMPVDGWVKSTWGWLKDQLTGCSVQMAVEQLQMHENYLLELAGKVQHVFQLPSQDLHAYEHPQPKMSVYALEQLWAPETEPGNPNKLTVRGRTQVKQGLRKFSPLAAMDVKAQGRRAESFIKSYEIPFLVNLLRHLSDVLNRWWFYFLDHYVQPTCPTIADSARLYPINLRWLASYYNQLYLAVGLLLLYLGWSLLWLMFVGIERNKTVLKQIRRAAPPPIYRQAQR